MFISIEDDNLLAPKKAVEELAESYGSRTKKHEHLRPADLGLKSIGHFDFFKSRNSELWAMADQWYQQHTS